MDLQRKLEKPCTGWHSLVLKSAAIFFTFWVLYSFCDYKIWQKIEDGLFHVFFALGSGIPPPRKPGGFRTLLYAEVGEQSRVGGNSRV